MAEDKQGETNEPEEIAAEGSVGEQEQPTERQQDREQAIAGEPVAESEQRAAEATRPAGPPAAAAAASAPAAPTAGPPAEPAAPTDDDEDDEDAAPRVKPAIPGMDLEVDIVREGEDALRRGEEGYEYDEDAAEGQADGDEDLAQPIADASIDLAAGARYHATGKRKT